MLPRFAKFLYLLVCAFCCSDISRAEETDFGAYARAVEYCRGQVQRPMAFDLDNRVLCFDGVISRELDASAVNRLEQNGLFVVRSPGGDVPASITLANLLRDRNATVVVYDYCLLSCASFLAFASETTIVMKESIIAWAYSRDLNWCPSMFTASDGGPKRLDLFPCSDSPGEYQRGFKELQDLSKRFYEARSANALAEWPPQSAFVRKVLRSRLEETGRVPNVYWTWNPRLYSRAIKTKVTYEAYPQSQSEVDALVTKLGLPKVIYDP